MGSRLPDGIVASIAVLGNPVVFWGGAAAVVLQLLRTLRGKAKPAVWFVLALWAAQYLPWALITRATFLYHYFAAMAAVTCCCSAAAAARRGPGCGYTGGKTANCNSGFLPVKRRQPVRGRGTSTQGSTGAPLSTA